MINPKSNVIDDSKEKIMRSTNRCQQQTSSNNSLKRNQSNYNSYISPQKKNMANLMPNNYSNNNRNFQSIIKKTEIFPTTIKDGNFNANRFDNYNININNHKESISNLPNINQNKNLISNPITGNNIYNYPYQQNYKSSFNVENNIQQNQNNLKDKNYNKINGGYITKIFNEPTRLISHNPSFSTNEVNISIKTPIDSGSNKIFNNMSGMSNNLNIISGTKNNISINNSQNMNNKPLSGTSRPSSRSHNSTNEYINSYKIENSIPGNMFNSYNQNSQFMNNNHNENKFINNDCNTSNVLSKKFDISKKLIGLENLGNTCFMNTSLQCILHCDIFISRFLDFCDNKKPLRPTPIANSLLNVIEIYCKKSDKSSISPLEIKTQIGKKHRIYSGYSQQDSQEFIRKILDEISQEFNLVANKMPYRILNPNNESISKKELNYEYDKIFREKEDSIVVDTFYGQSVSIFQCMDCDYESYSFEKFLDIPLLLEENYSDQDLLQLLTKYFETEKIQWEIPCSKVSCKRKSIHKKRLKFSYLPDILILSLQRYSNRLRRKNNCKVNYKHEIDLREYTDNTFFSEERTTKYTLIAISNHSGSLDFGHYYAYCKVNEIWYEFNDSNVSRLNYMGNSSENAYVLFYKKQ